MSQGAVPADTAAELKERIEAERRGTPFVIYRNADGTQVLRELPDADARLTIGRSESADIALPFDSEVSRVHAALEQLGDAWTLTDEGLSRNGSFVNGERVVGRRRLRDGDALRFGGTLVLFRSPSEVEAETVAASGRPDAGSVTET